MRSAGWRPWAQWDVQNAGEYVSRVDPVGELALGDERGVYRQRIAPSRLKSTTRRLVKRRVDTQAFGASRRNTASRSPRALIASAK